MVVYPLSDGVGWGIVEGRMVEGMTNSDKLRAMTDEELAEWLEGHCYQTGWAEWLKQELTLEAKTVTSDSASTFYDLLYEEGGANTT